MGKGWAFFIPGLALVLVGYHIAAQANAFRSLLGIEIFTAAVLGSAGITLGIVLWLLKQK